jgi:hypothetical protein
VTGELLDLEIAEFGGTSTPERVAELLKQDAALTDEQRTALAELFEAAYENLVDNEGERV